MVPAVGHICLHLQQCRTYHVYHHCHSSTGQIHLNHVILRVIFPAEYIQTRGYENVTAEEVVRFIRPEGRAAVPDNIKAELLTRIKTFILQL